MNPIIFSVAETVTPTVTPMTMADLLSSLGTVVTKALAWVTESVSTITSNPFILMTAGFLVLGGAIGILGRLLSRR